MKTFAVLSTLLFVGSCFGKDPKNGSDLEGSESSQSYGYGYGTKVADQVRPYFGFKNYLLLNVMDAMALIKERTYIKIGRTNHCGVVGRAFASHFSSLPSMGSNPHWVQLWQY